MTLEYSSLLCFHASESLDLLLANLLQDHIERGNIDFRSLKFRVLDEVDEMLKIGFVDDVEFILGMLLSSGILTLFYDVSPPLYLVLSVISV